MEGFRQPKSHALPFYPFRQSINLKRNVVFFPKVYMRNWVNNSKTKVDRKKTITKLNSILKLGGYKRGEKRKIIIKQTKKMIIIKFLK